MANNPFDRRIINVRERPLSSDINLAQSELDYATRLLMQEAISPRLNNLGTTLVGQPRSGFMGAGLQIIPNGTMNVAVQAGLGMIYDVADVPVDINGAIGLNDSSPTKPVVLMANKTFAVPANASGSERRDIIEVRNPRLVTDALSRDTLNSVTGQFIPGSWQKTMTYVVDNQTGTVTSPASSTAALSYKVGVPGAGVPATSSGYVRLGEIIVPNGAASITGSGVIDWRRLLVPGGVINVGLNFQMLCGPSGGASALVVSAPPGVRVGVFNNNAFINRLSGVVCVIAGGTLFTGVPTIGMYSNGASAATTPPEIRHNLLTIDSGVQAALIGGQSALALPTAVGQPYGQFLFAFETGNPDGESFGLSVNVNLFTQ